MNNMLTTKRFWALVAIILLGAFARVVEHPPNFTPVLAIALFAGAYFSHRRWAFLVPITALIASDVVLSVTMGHEYFTLMRAVIYASVILITCAGFWMRSGVNIWKLGVSTLGGAILFFLVTNFVVWAQGHLYPLTWEGLVSCYVAAIPFFRNTLASTAVYAALFFGVFELAKARFPVLRIAGRKATA